MKSIQKIADDFSFEVDRFLSDADYGMREAATCYAIKDGYSTSEIAANSDGAYQNDLGGTTQPQQKPDRRAVVANIMNPYINAQCGVITKDKVTFTAYSTDPQFSGEVDVGNDVIKWGVENSGYNIALTNTVLDVLVRGIGGSIWTLDFTNEQFPFGVPSVESKYYLFYDRAPGQSLGSHNAAWCGYADPVYREELDRYIEAEGGFPKGQEGSAGTSFDAQLLQYVSESPNDIAFLYHYFWREWTDIRLVDNPLVVHADVVAALAEVHPELLTVLGVFAREQQVDLERVTKWRLDNDGWKAYQELLKIIDSMTSIPLPKTDVIKRKMRCYYKAELADGKVLKKSQAFSRDCHPLNLCSGFYDRRAGCYYGTGRSMANVQIALHDALSDLATYTSRASTGGTVGIKGMGTELANTIDSIRNNERSFPLPENGAIQQLGTADAAQSMMGFVSLLIDLLPVTGGAGKEILGMMNKDTPAASLYRAAQQQQQVSLAPIINGVNQFIANSGKLFRDSMFEMASSIDGEFAIPKISPGKDESAYIYLSKQNLARNYSVVMDTEPTSEDERHDQFLKLSEIVGKLPPELQVAAMPDLIKLASMDEESKQNLIKVLTPQQGDPREAQRKVQRAEVMEDAQVRMINAQAAKLEQDANVSGQQAPVQLEETQSVIERNIASARASEAKAAQTLAQI